MKTPPTCGSLRRSILRVLYTGATLGSLSQSPVWTPSSLTVIHPAHLREPAPFGSVPKSPRSLFGFSRSSSFLRDIFYSTLFVLYTKLMQPATCYSTLVVRPTYPITPCYSTRQSVPGVLLKKLLVFRSLPEEAEPLRHAACFLVSSTPPTPARPSAEPQPLHGTVD